MKNPNTITVRVLINKLQKIEKTAPHAIVKFLDSDDVTRSSANVVDAMTVLEFQESLGHEDALRTITEAGLKDGEVVLLGLTL